jgi:hypothetical protein
LRYLRGPPHGVSRLVKIVSAFLPFSHSSDLIASKSTPIPVPHYDAGRLGKSRIIRQGQDTMCLVAMTEQEFLKSIAQAFPDEPFRST